MSREFPEERMIVERLWEIYHKDHLTAKEIAAFDGCSPRTAKRRYQISGGGMSIGCLAHLKCLLARR